MLMKLHIRNKLSDFLKLITLYTASLIVGTVLYIASFWINLIDTQSIPIVGAIAMLLIMCIFISAVLLIMKKFKTYQNILTYRDIILIFVLLFSFNYNLYGMIPFNCARSNSIVMIGYLYKNNGMPKTEKEIQDFVEDKYFHKYQAIQKRLQEQIDAGNIKKVNDGYILTKRGILVVKTFGWITALYNMDQNFTKL